MGYYSNFYLSIPTIKDVDEQDVFIGELEKTEDCIRQYSYSNSLKWYGVDEDMVSISKKYPQHIFEMERVGEEHEDETVTRYHNGEFEVISPVKTWPPFIKIVLDNEKSSEEEKEELPSTI